MATKKTVTIYFSWLGFVFLWTKMAFRFLIQQRIKTLWSLMGHTLLILVIFAFLPMMPLLLIYNFLLQQHTIFPLIFNLVMLGVFYYLGLHSCTMLLRWESRIAM